MKTIVIVVSDLMTIKAFMLPHIRTLAEHFRVHIIANSSESKLPDYECQIHHASIQRAIAPLSDIKAIFSLVRLLNKLDADMVLSITPKAGLLAMLAAFLNRTPNRIHYFTGQVWKNMTGAKRKLFRFLDRVLFNCTTYALVDSLSQRQFLLQEKVINVESSTVLGKGSVCGVNTMRFSKNDTARQQIRSNYSIADDDIVFLFIGRLKRDKGVLDLVNAFKMMLEEHTKIRLLLVGPDEEQLLPEIESILCNEMSVFHYTGYTNVPEEYLSAADVFCLPSYREGFGSVIIEAAAAGLPAIGTKIYGIEDAIEDGKSGLMYTAGNINELVDCMTRLTTSDKLRADLGAYAQRRVVENFAEEKLTSALLDFVKERFKLCDGSHRNGT